MTEPYKIKRKDIHRVRNEIKDTQLDYCVLCGGNFSDYTYHYKKQKVVPKYRPTLDHCHTTGNIRGVLCSYCNSIEGKLNTSINRYHPYLNDPYDRATFVIRLGQYLDRHRENRTGLIHPDHKTEEEKRLHRNKKQRVAYAKSKGE